MTVGEEGSYMGRGECCLKAAFAAVLFPSVSIGTISAGLESEVNSRYVWRGLVQDENPVIQPSAWGSLGNLTLEVWSSWPTRRASRLPAPTELDFTLEYQLVAAGFEVVPEAAVWWYPTETETPVTNELSVRLSRGLGPVSVSTGHAVDIGAFPGAYFGDAGLSWERELFRGLSAEASVSAGWGSPAFNRAYAGPGRWALNLVETEASVTWQILPFLYLRPHLGAAALVDAGLRAVVERPAGFVAGLAAGCGLQ
ncbi:MAG: hypothetical protein ABIK86_00645 [candidate division WOR-3 bacterium]